MNKLREFSRFVAPAILLVSLAGAASAQQKTSSPGDEFFVVSSVDRTHNALVLLRPTQIASVFQVSDKTQYSDENGKPLKLADLRAGDTLYVTSEKKSDGTVVVDRARKGIMTVDELRRRYSPGLPADAGRTTQTMSAPKSSAPKANSSTANTASPKNTKTGTPNSNTATSKTPKSGNAKSSGSTATAPKKKQQTFH